MKEPVNNFALPYRRGPAHQPILDHHNHSVIVFLTVCTKDRRSLLASEESHCALLAAWTSATHWRVGRYVLMPDHVHLFCTPGVLPHLSLANWVRHWKTSLCKATKLAAGTIWQRDFWDTQLRGHESYASKWEYVRNNPVRAKLVTHHEDWPYQGEMSVLRWHD